jgi:integrative and conjugative element protein (TIGR02256 family)
VYVLVCKEVLSAIRDASHYRHPLETGGFLIGLRRGPHIEVTGLTQQAEGDIATRASFDRAGPAHRENIHRAWRDSIEIETLVGDWHSHPEGPALPSPTDRRAWRKLVAALKQPVLGLIESDSGKPNLYLVTAARFRSVITLRTCEEGPEHITFEAERRWSERKPFGWLKPND